MAKKYKLWIEIEEIDEENDTYEDVTRGGGVLPAPIGEFATLDEAVAEMETLSEAHYGGPI